MNTTIAPPSVDIGMVKQALVLLADPAGVVECRMPKTGRSGTVSGYFSYDALDKLATAVVPWNGRAAGVYITLNTVCPDLLSRAYNRLIERAESTTSDVDIMRRRWLPLDFDPKRAAGISSTEAEHAAALDLASRVAAALRRYGWPDPLETDSGNGAHLLYRIDLPNDEASLQILKKVLEAVAFQFQTDAVDIDTGVYNAARIWKLYGTVAAKGDSTPQRPHRVAHLLRIPASVDVVSLQKLQALAELAPPAEQPAQHQMNGHGGDFDLAQWVRTHNLPVVSAGPWQGGYKWILNPCPWNSDHTNRAAFIVQRANGAIAAGCHHNGCGGKTWHDLRALYEPTRSSPGHSAPSGEGAKQPRTPAPPPPAPVAPELDEAALYGLAGDAVRMIEPHSEAHGVALLGQFLTAFGNVAGRGAHFVAEADQHFMNLFIVLVGETAKGRKGTSWGHIRRLFESADEDWVKLRILTGLSSGEGLIWAVRDPVEEEEPLKEKGVVTGYQTVVTDPGVTDKRGLVYEAEFASTLRVSSRDGNTLTAVIRNCWDTGSLSTLTKNATNRATGAHISIIGHITKTELLRYLDSTEAANGFANRFLWLCVRRTKLLPEGGAMHTVDVAPFVLRLRAALDFARDAGELHRDEEAKAIWHRVYGELGADRPGLLGAVTARAEAQVMRLACLYALLDQSTTIRAEHLTAALALWDYAEESAAYIFGDALGDPTADTLLAALREAEQGMTRTEIRELFGRNKSSTTLTRALEALAAAGKAHYVKDEADGQGRPAERWYAL